MPPPPLLSALSRPELEALLVELLGEGEGLHQVVGEQREEIARLKGLKAVVVVESIRETGDKIERETRFYITSLVLMANLLGPIVRSHWAIENCLHWVMDMVFRDDECRVRTDHAPANFTTIKHIAYNLMRRAPGKASQRLKRTAAAWDDDFLASLVAG